MSMPNLTNNLTQQQQQNIIINHQVPHTIVTNVSGTPNNGIAIASAPMQKQILEQHQVGQGGEIKTGIMIDAPSIVNAAPPHQSVAVPNSTKNANMQNMHSTTNNNTSSDGPQILSKTRMSDLIRDIDPNINMEEEVEEILLGYVDDFVDRVLNGASMIAKHRHVKNIEVKDVQMFVNRNYNMWAPGLGTDELRPYKRSLTTESHKQRLALIRKALKKY